MTANSELIARAYQVQVVTLDDDGYPMGQLLTPNSPVNGTVYASYLVPGFVEYRPPTAQRANSYEYSNERYRNNRPGAVQSFNAGQLILSRRDAFVNRLAGGSDEDVSTLTGLSLSSSNTMNGDPAPVGLILSAGSLNHPGKIVNICLSKVTLSPADTGINQSTGKNPNNQTYNIMMDVSVRTLLGLLYAATALNVTGDEDSDLFVVADGVLIISTWADDATATTITLPYPPASTEVAGAINSITKNGVDNSSNVSGDCGEGGHADLWHRRGHLGLWHAGRVVRNPDCIGRIA